MGRKRSNKVQKMHYADDLPVLLSIKEKLIQVTLVSVSHNSRFVAPAYKRRANPSKCKCLTLIESQMPNDIIASLNTIIKSGYDTI